MRFIILVFLSLSIYSCQDSDHMVISTPQGQMTIQLLGTTPQHKNNFKKLVRDGFYNGLLFHRVMKEFMIQGGDPESKNAAIDLPLGSGGPGYTIPAEIGTPHFKGMISAARLGDGVNPKKESSGSQFFIVHGHAVTDNDLDMVEHSKGIKYSIAQREKYKKMGGTPELDGEYTVFGEVISGLDVVDKIANLPTDSRDRPTQNIPMNIK